MALCMHLSKGPQTVIDSAAQGCAGEHSWQAPLSSRWHSARLRKGLRVNLLQVFCEHYMGDTSLWDWGHNGVGSAALVYDARLGGQGSQVSCSAARSLPDCLGVCAEGLDGPRLAPGIQTKMFS